MTHFAMTRTALTNLMTAVMFYGLVLAPASHADYLSDLEAEAQKQESKNGAVEEASNYKPGSLTDNSLHKGLNRKGFEENLRHSSLGSYHVFTKLNSTSQEQVYMAYQGGDSLDELRTLIKDLYNQLK